MKIPDDESRLALAFLGAVVLVSAGILGWIVVSAFAGGATPWTGAAPNPAKLLSSWHSPSESSVSPTSASRRCSTR